MIRRKRNTWIVEKNGQVFKFGTEAEANAAAHGVPDAPKEKEFHQEEDSTNEQEVVLESEGGSEEEV
jgi:hypothetical protein